jgi:hypothetical protein
VEGRRVDCCVADGVNIVGFEFSSGRDMVGVVGVVDVVEWRDAGWLPYLVDR